MAPVPTLADRVLAHLQHHPIQVDAQDVPREVTQEGISDALSVRVAHVSRALKALVDMGLVTAHLAHPRGGARRARAHALTEKGHEAAKLVPAPQGAPPVDRSTRSPRAVRTPAGREAQMATLLAALDRAKNGRVVALVEGDAGSGKTRLLDALTHAAKERGATVAIAHAAPVGEEQILGPVARALSPHGFERRYRARDAGTPRERAMSAAIDTVTSTAREDVLLLALDDLQHAGASAAEFLYGLAVGLPPATRVLIVAAFRREEAWALPNGPLYTALAPLRTMPGALHVDLKPLDQEGVAALLDDAGVHVNGERKLPSDLVARVYRESGGNPLYALAMGEALADGVDEEDFFPAAVRSDAMKHFASLPDATLAVLQVAAVAGAEVEYATLARGSGLEEHALVGHLDVLLDRLVLEEVPGGSDLRLRFRHPKVREALLGDLSATKRRFLESRVAGANGS